MSRIGKKPVTVPGGVTAQLNGQEVKVKGPKGELKHVLADAMVAKLDDGGIEIAMREDTKEARALWGMSRTLVANLIAGVTEGFDEKLAEFRFVPLAAGLVGGDDRAPRRRHRRQERAARTRRIDERHLLR